MIKNPNKLNIVADPGKQIINSLADSLTGYWGEEHWVLKDCPALATPLPETRRIGTLDFSNLSANVSTEVRYALQLRFFIKKWKPSSGILATQVRKIIAFLEEKLPNGKSLLERSPEAWEIMLRTWLIEKGEYYISTRAYVDKNYEKKEFTNGNACISAFKGIYAEVERAHDTRPEWELDVWDLRRLGIEINPTKSQFRLSFKTINHLWLREGAKKYMRFIVISRSPSSCSTLLAAVSKFGKFADERHPDLKPEEIDRKLALEYAAYLVEIGASPQARRDFLLDLDAFLGLAAREEWLPVSGRRMIFRDDLPPRAKRHPRFIPESVMRQIEEHLSSLELFWQQMMIVLIECGMRISELCAIKLDCLSEDADGDYFLTYYQFKLKKDHTVPISQETAAVIKERIATIRREGKETKYLFSFHPGSPVRQDSFSKRIRQFFHDHQIQDATGQVWQYQPHQSRHTVGTRMINNGTPQIMVQRFLGHETPVMTSVYAHIHDQTLKDEFEKYLDRSGKRIDIKGDVISSPDEKTKSADTVDLQWFKKNVLAQALPNGYCGLPLQQGGCPHANACLTCGHFQTDRNFLPQHRAQLVETKRLVQISRANKWERQIEMNEKVEKNLEKIISTLEKEVKSNEQTDQDAA